jgi:ubiquinone/menaquinone biosynthesis C-methylase UbiE
MSERPFFDSGFENADAYSELQVLIRSLDNQNQHPTFFPIHDVLQQHLNHSIDDLILEVGCGLGDSARLMSGKNPQATVIAIDKSHELLKEAHNRTDFNRFKIEYRLNDVMQLDFEKNIFSFAHAERVLMHVSSPKKALSEMVRVLKKKGRILVAEPDLSSARILPDFEGIGEMMIDTWCSFTQSPAIGQQLLSYFYGLPLKNIQIFVHPIQIRSYQEINQIRSLDKLFTAVVGNNRVSSEKARYYKKLLEQYDQQGQFLYYVNMYTVTAEKM